MTSVRRGMTSVKERGVTSVWERIDNLGRGMTSVREKYDKCLEEV